MENGTYEQIVTHLESDLELKGLEALNDLQINTVIQHATNTNVDRPKPTCHHCIKPVEYRNQCYLLKKKEQVVGTQTNPGNKNNGSKNSIPSNNKINNRNKKDSIRPEREPETVFPCCETCGKMSHYTERCYVRANAANRPLPWKKKPEAQNGHHQQDAQNSMTGCVRATAQYIN